MADDKNGDWVRTIIGALSAIVVTMSGVYTVIIIPQTVRIDKLEVGREKDSDRLALLYTSIQTNDEYKKKIGVDLEWIRSDIMKLREFAFRIDSDQKQRVSIAAITSVESRIDRIEKNVEDLRQRSMVPIVTKEVVK